jgi:hypothetical protein
MSPWYPFMTFSLILAATTLLTLRLLHALAARRREARWNRGQRVD